jgi:hypothetical protein
MAEHYIIKCKKCDTIMGQCRCASPSKSVRYEICENCKAKECKSDSPNVMCSDCDC